MSLQAIEEELDRFEPAPDVGAVARRLLALAEEVLMRWVEARGDTPTHDTREGFRLLALHRQGASGTPSFNACRETCREIAFHYNMLILEPDSELAADRSRMMALLVKHLTLFVRGKLEVEGLGEFCCASKPLRTNENVQ